MGQCARRIVCVCASLCVSGAKLRVNRPLQRQTLSVSQSAVQPTHPEETEATAKAELLQLPIISLD